MPETTFEAAVRLDKGIAVIDLSGDMNAFAEPGLDAAYHRAAASDPTTILLNFNNVGYINSTGIAVIVGLLAQARMARRRVLVCGLTEHYREIFNITRLSDFMTIFPDEAAAVAATPA